MSIRSTLPVSAQGTGRPCADLETRICCAGRPAAAKATNLALQGGGAHGAFAWGVLHQLLEDERTVLDGVSGAIAGVPSAARLASGVAVGGQAGAQRALAMLWRRLCTLLRRGHCSPTCWAD
jgi:NTE family protein